MVKEAINEVLLEQGVLSTIISEIVVGLNKNVIVEQQQDRAINQAKVAQSPQPAQPGQPDPLTERMNKMKLERKAMLDRIGNSSIGGVNIFEGTTPALEDPTAGDPLGGQDPNDPGVNIDGLLGLVGNKWKNSLVTK